MQSPGLKPPQRSTALAQAVTPHLSASTSFTSFLHVHFLMSPRMVFSLCFWALSHPKAALNAEIKPELFDLEENFKDHPDQSTNLLHWAFLHSANVYPLLSFPLVGLQ